MNAATSRAATVRNQTIRVLIALTEALQERTEDEVPTPAVAVTFEADGNAATITAGALPGPFKSAGRRSGFKTFTDLTYRAHEGEYLRAGVMVTISTEVTGGTA